MQYPYRIRDGLYLGNITNAAEILTSPNSSLQGITHILSLLSSTSISCITARMTPHTNLPHPKEVKKVCIGDKLLYSLEMAGIGLRIKRMAVPLEDGENENLLACLDACLDFIDEGRREGVVLVHCFAGISRSASTIIAYLMRKERRNWEDAYRSLKGICNSVHPNNGFFEQLKLFEAMGYKVDTSNTKYMRFRLKLLGKKKVVAVMVAVGITPRENNIIYCLVLFVCLVLLGCKFVYALMQ